MKSRIIEMLFLLSIGDKTSSRIAKEIFGDNAYDEIKIFNKAGILLNTILNDYSAFEVGTIDRFFQWVIRSFARETGLQAGYNLELNNRRVLIEAIDLLMFSLDHDQKLKEWLVKYAGDKISSGKDWDFFKDIYNLGSEIFKEQYQDITGGSTAALEQKNKIDVYKEILSNEVKNFENYLAAIGNDALRYILEAGLTPDSFTHRKAGVAGYFLKLSKKKDFDPKIRAREALDHPEKWVSANSESREEVLALVNNCLNSLLNRAITFYDKNLKIYNTAQIILRNLFAFGILTDIYLKVREISKDQNLFLLSDATVFLKRIIANNETPFIYEKAGNYFTHFMIDEFQDTSRYQWENFHPLIINGLGTGNDSLIVGDVKQAIYRWRNSDWKILAGNMQNSFPGFDICIEPLDTNWRSHKNIIAFNNSLFSASPKVLMVKMEQDSDEIINEEFIKAWKDTITEIYQNSLQKVSNKKLDTEGYVEAAFFNLKKPEYLDMLSARLPALIKELLSRGFNQGDIAILVRKGEQGRDIANILMNYKSENPDEVRFNIISNDSLFIENHSSVRFLVAMLKYLKNPSDQLNTAFIKYEFITYLSGDGLNFADIINIFDHCDQGIVKGICKEFDDFIELADSLKRRPLFELTEELINLFGLNKNVENIAFIQAFQDLVLDFVRNQTADISSFLSWWELLGCNQTLTVSEDQDAIRIMTIHKAKGLQFPVVLIPYCDWNMDIESLRTNYIWCKNDQSPFNFIENVPVNYGKGLSNSYFQLDYLNEKFHNYVDNLNLLYVSFTRPEEELYILANLEKKDTAATLINKIVLSGIKDDFPGFEEYPEINLYKYFNESENTLIVGNKKLPQPKEIKIMPEFIREYPVSHGGDRLRLNVKNAWLLSNENDFHKKLGYGTVMHEILSGIEVYSEIAASVSKAILRGKIPSEEFNTLVKFLESEISKPGIQEWFDGSWKLMKEREIKSSDNNIYRPDRVMIKNGKLVLIDFKFGVNIIVNHKRQVLNYTETIKKMGYTEVKGYLWYVSLGQFLEVL